MSKHFLTFFFSKTEYFVINIQFVWRILMMMMMMLSLLTSPVAMLLYSVISHWNWSFIYHWMCYSIFELEINWLFYMPCHAKWLFSQFGKILFEFWFWFETVWLDLKFLSLSLSAIFLLFASFFSYSNGSLEKVAHINMRKKKSENPKIVSCKIKTTGLFRMQKKTRIDDLKRVRER